MDDKRLVKDCLKGLPQAQRQLYDSFAPTIKRAASINLAQFIQCIACVLYQCAEYLTHETETYKQWRDLQYQLAYSYFVNSPDYQTTKWDL